MTPVYVIANPSGLVCLDLQAKPIGLLVQLPTGVTPSGISVDWPRRQLLFTLTTTGQGSRPGADIAAVDLVGGEVRTLIAHEAGTFYDTPLLEPTGTWLYYHRTAPAVGPTGDVRPSSTIERRNLKTGERTIVLADALAPSLSYDGTLLVFIRLKEGQIDGLWIARNDGSDMRPLLRESFTYLQSPRFSPNADNIVFSAAGRIPPRGEQGSVGHHAHLGIPSEIFVVQADGSGLRSVAKSGDDTSPTWSPDGTRLAYVTTGGAFVVDVSTGTVQTMSAGSGFFFFGDLAWLR